MPWRLKTFGAALEEIGWRWGYLVMPLRELVLQDLRRGMRLMMRVQEDIDPQFRIATPEGDIAVSATFPESVTAKRELFALLGKFFAWKQALAYTMTFNLAQPNALMTVGVSARDAVGCILRFAGEPGTLSEMSFEEPVWVSPDSIGDEFLSLLPERTSVLSEDDLRELESWFGVEGRFPAVHIATGRSGF